MSTSLKELQNAFSNIVAAQLEQVEMWHINPLQEIEETDEETGITALSALAGCEHQVNFMLWHVEDEARQKDVEPRVIADCKYRIDKLNQKRNDFIEKLDLCLVQLITPLVPVGAKKSYNTETLGSVLDRLSILALKIYHMHEESVRIGASVDHHKACKTKLGILQQQRATLLQSALHLFDDYSKGYKRPLVYFQFKMYNDPNLNPALYGKNRR